MSRAPVNVAHRGTPTVLESLTLLDDEDASDDGENEWRPPLRGRRPLDNDNDDNDARSVDDDDDFIVNDLEEDEEEEGGSISGISEAEEDNDFEEPMNNRPKRATRSTGASKKKRKRTGSSGDVDGDGEMAAEGEGEGGGDLSPRATRREQRNRSRRRELATIRDDDDLDDPTARARQAEKERASHMLFHVDANDNDAAEDALEPLLFADEQASAIPLVCLNPSNEDGVTPPDGEIGTEDQPVFVHPAVSNKLKKHQVKGAQFLWSHVAVEPTGFGCILADFMGLGKTLQVLTIVQAFLTLKRRRPSDGVLVNRHKHVLILAPTICVRNWEAEVVKWFGKKDARKLGVHTLESSREKKMVDRVGVVKQWHRRGGILIMGYELYRILVLQSSGDEKIAKGNAKHAHLIRQVYECLSDPGPDLIVLDEGHRVRDHKSKLVKALSHVKTARRIILTGYPLQNHLEEYWTMVNFARPDYLGSLEDFKNRFVHPIENGQCVDSTEGDRRLARQRAYVLTNELKTLVLRRDQEFLFKQLPPKKEWVLLCKLTPNQATLYRRFLQFGVPKRGELLPGVGGKIDVLGGYHISLAISNHPDVLQETFKHLEDGLLTGKLGAAAANRKGKAKGRNDDGEDEDLLQYLVEPAPNMPTGRCRGSSDDDDDDDMSFLDALDVGGPGGGPGRAGGSSSIVKANGRGRGEHRLGFARDFMRDYTSGMLESSGKMMLLMELLTECKAIGDRVILFSQSIPTLNTVENMIHQSNRREKRHRSRLSYLRIDGSTPQQERFRMISQFNDWEEDTDLIMISTKAGGEGVNLCAGNRIVIFDVCWNPCNDSQSMCRSYRFGQVKPVFVYRFVSAGTMEKKVYDLQIRKEGVAKRIVDEKALERKFKNADLQNYFNLDDFEMSMQQQSTVLGAPFPPTREGATSGKDNESADDHHLMKHKKEEEGEKNYDATGKKQQQEEDDAFVLELMDDDDDDEVVEVGRDGMATTSTTCTPAPVSAASSVESASPSATAPAPVSQPLDGPPGNDTVLEKVLNKMYDEKLDWVIEWFEQETMFEETIDDNCSATEQEEITASYTYFKAVRRLKLNDTGGYGYAYGGSASGGGSSAGGANRDSVLVVACMNCRIPNDVYPEETTNVPVPKYIECRYCKRPTLTTGAVTHAQALANNAAAMAAAAAAGVPQPSGLLPGGRGGYVPYNHPQAAAAAAAAAMQALDTGGVAPIQNGAVVGPGRVLPPHLQQLHQQQQQQAHHQQQQQLLLQQRQQQLLALRQQQLLQMQQQQNQATQPNQQPPTTSDLIRRQVENQRRELERRRQERTTWKLADRNLLVLRRGISKVQELKAQAQRCGAAIAIEINAQLTDIVSSMSLQETLQLLKVSKLPRDVELHDDTWLRNEIAKETGASSTAASSAPSSNASTASSTASLAGQATPQTQAATTAASHGKDTSPDSLPDMIAIDLSDDDDNDPDGDVTMATTTANGRDAAAAAAADDDDDDDVVEIL